MADCLGIDVDRVDRATDRLLQAGLVDLRPWRTGLRDGVWQILPVERQVSARTGMSLSVAEILRSLGIARQPGSTGPGAK
jgi:hypothetical protein